MNTKGIKDRTERKKAKRVARKKRPALPKSTADELLEQRANVSRGSWWVPRWEPVARKAAAKTAAHQMKESPSR